MREAGKDVDTAALKRVCPTTIFRWTQQVPAGLGTFLHGTRCAPQSGCPGIKGPVPPPVSMDAGILPGTNPHVNPFMPIER